MKRRRRTKAGYLYLLSNFLISRWQSELSKTVGSVSISGSGGSVFSYWRTSASAMAHLIVCIREAVRVLVYDAVKSSGTKGFPGVTPSSGSGISGSLSFRDDAENFVTGDAEALGNVGLGKSPRIQGKYGTDH
jgi:hypothetical protein